MREGKGGGREKEEWDEIEERDERRGKGMEENVEEGKKHTYTELETN